MIVVHLTASRFFGGPERQMLELAQSLSADIRSVFISFAEDGLCCAFCDQVRNAGFEAIGIEHDMPHLIAAYRDLVAILRAAKVDLLCCHGYKADLLGLLAARHLRIPVISVSRGWTAECARVQLYEMLDRRVLRHMDRVVCVSEAQAEKVRRIGVRRDKVVVIRNAIRPERFRNCDETYRQKLLAMFSAAQRSRVPCSVSAPFVVGAAGRLSPEKGFSVFVSAAQELLASPLPESVSRSPLFVLFGDGPLRESLARQIADAGLQDKFILAGFHADLDRYLPHLDLFVQSSYTEGLPNVVLEAMAAGVPVVATDVGGTSELIEDRKTGRLIPPGDSRQMADCMRDALRQDDAEMRLRAKNRVNEQFGFAAQATQYRNLLVQLTSAARLSVGKDSLTVQPAQDRAAS